MISGLSMERRELVPRGQDLRVAMLDYWDGEIVWDCPLANFSTLRVGGPARGVAFPKGVKELAVLVKGLQKEGIPWRIIGRGSNILIPDEGFPGIVIVLGPQFAGIEKVSGDESHVQVKVEAGCSLSRLLRWAIDFELSGLEFAAGIPGSVGGAIVMNAGAFGKEIGQVVESIVLMDAAGNFSALGKDEFEFSYRQLKVTRGAETLKEGMVREGGSEAIVVSVIMKLARGNREQIEARCRKLNRLRKEKQPQGIASAGSFFKNPEGRAAGRLVDEAGLKGCRVGGAMVSPQHANFIVNMGDATARDILDLMEVVQKRVFSTAGVWLEPEVDIWGEWEH